MDNTLKPSKSSKALKASNKVIESDSTTMEGGSKWSSILINSPKDYKLVYSIISDLGHHFEVEPMFTYIFNTNEDEVKEISKKLNKSLKIKNKKKDAIFKPEGFKKCPSGFDLFGKVLQEKCKSEGIKYSIKFKSSEWALVSSEDKAKYNSNSGKLKEVSLIKLKQEKELAISNGLWPQDKIKQPSSSYFLYQTAVSESVKLLFAGDTNSNTKSKSKTGEMWNALSEEEKEPYVRQSKIAREKYNIDLAVWKKKEEERLRKLSGKTVDTKIESAGSANTTVIEQQALILEENNTINNKVVKGKKGKKVAQIDNTDDEVVDEVVDDE